MNANIKRILFPVILVLLVIGFLEITLSMLSSLSPRIDKLFDSPWTAEHVPPTVPDPLIEDRPNPKYPGHDSRGFRNPRKLDKAHIVVLGDSQTYGVGVEPEFAWPMQLDSMIDESVYSMACPGSGPIQSLVLWDEADDLEPKVVVKGFYMGNDLYDSYHQVYDHGRFAEFKSVETDLKDRIQKAEQVEPLSERIERLFQIRKAGSGRQLPPNPVADEAFSPQKLLSEYSNIYRLFQRAGYEFTRLAGEPEQTSAEKWENWKAFAAAFPEKYEVFDNGRFKTIFTSQYRLAGMDLMDPRIEEGFRLSLKAMGKINEYAVAKKIRFIVLLIPTKEMVFRILQPNDCINYRCLTEYENQIRTMTVEFLEQSGIEYMDILPVMRERLASGVQPYPASGDGHPNAEGHRAIAVSLASYLKSSAGRDTVAKNPAVRR